MDSVATIVGVVAALIIIGIGYMITKASEASEPVEAAVAVNGEEVAAAQEKKKKKKKGNVGLARMRERHKKGQSTGGGATTALLVEDAEADSEDESERQQQLSKKKIGAKKAAKLEAKAERREAQEAMKKIREDEKAREDLRFAEEKKEREKEAEAERDQEEEEARKAEELKQKEEEEYQAMKAMFSVEEAGSVAETIQTESQGLLAEFVDYIKDTKVVLLEDLATRFGLKTQDAIMRLKNLEEMGRITGVMDDRGKYIYISDDEMNAVVKFIKQRGRVTLADLSENSHKLIRLGGELCPALTESG